MPFQLKCRTFNGIRNCDKNVLLMKDQRADERGVVVVGKYVEGLDVKLK